MEQSEKKKSTWALPWIITGVLIIILLGYLWYLNQREPDGAKAPVVQESPAARRSDPTVAAYVSFIDTGDNKMALEHAFSSEALHKLADATAAVARVNAFTLSQPVDSVKIYAGNITEDKYAVSHADDIRHAANIVSAALANLQAAKYPALSADADALREAAGKINPDRLTLDQRAEVKGFFRSAAALLQKMN